MFVKTFEFNFTYTFVQARVHKSESMNQVFRSL